MGKVIWTRDAVIAKALEFDVKKDFVAKAPGAYASAKTLGILVDVCAHMTRRVLPEEAALGRKCTACNIFKTPNMMSKDSRNKSGIGSICKPCHSLRTSLYALKNVAWKRSATAKRRAMRVKATPSWLTTNHFAEIKKHYECARILTSQTGVEHEVDHILPINGAKVCGLHVPWNLAVISRKDNREKSNKVIYV